MQRTEMTVYDNMPFHEITSQIIGAAMEVHKTLGPGFLEHIYEKALIVELSQHRKLGVKSQQSFEIEYKGENLGKHVLDMIVEDKVVIELKAVDAILQVHEAQIVSYLNATKLPVGLLINFKSPKLVFRRFANTLNNTQHNFL